jgi:hypothetical protein
MAAPFLLIGQIEEQLRWLVKNRINLDEALSASASPHLPREATTASLTMGDLHRVLSNPANWARVGIGFERSTFCRELDLVRESRNAVMHFRDLPEGATQRVQRFASVVQTAYLHTLKRPSGAPAD